MRPHELDALFAPLASLPGVGPRLALLFRKAVRLPPGIAEPRVLDLLFHLPHGTIDRRAEPAVAGAVPGSVATFRVRVLLHRPPPREAPHQPYRVACDDASGRLELVFFHGVRGLIERLLPPGSERIVSGRVERFGDSLQMAHPDYILSPDAEDQFPRIEPVYPLTAGLSGKTVQKAVRAALPLLALTAEWQDPAWLAARGWPAFGEALRRLHAPQGPGDTSPAGAARQRLAYDELLAGQLALALVRARRERRPGRPLSGDGRIRARILAALPFTLTQSQAAAVGDIAADMAAPRRMVRLLQGDVGSGKTAVALLAMAIAAEAGAQAALMAPTEVLARQHFAGIAPVAERAGLRAVCLTGREKGRARRDILEAMAAGTAGIVIGTHALLQEEAVFRDLALAVIDEQHRFGVQQRRLLQNKGGRGGVDVLVMTATPIPRTLLMTHYGDLDVSRLTGKPAGRKPVVTTCTPADRIGEVIEGLARALARGAQAYWVCPAIEDSSFSGFAAAQARHAHLAKVFGPVAGLLHGGLPAERRDAVMEAFAAGRLKILVATTVVEVGVNVPDATIMVIEHAERFGLAQLHQLRGRVGRGERQSYCVLLYKAPLPEAARARLDVLRETEDGFVIAEKDLALRGAGELLGARQSGLPEFRLADVPGFEALLAAARDDARLLLVTDPHLEGPRGQAARLLLYLFEQDEAVRLFRAA